MLDVAEGGVGGISDWVVWAFCGGRVWKWFEADVCSGLDQVAFESGLRLDVVKVLRSDPVFVSFEM